MSNRKRHSKCKPKLPNKFNDHIMRNLSQNHHGSYDIDDIEEIRVTQEDMGDKIEENSKMNEKGGDEVGNRTNGMEYGDSDADTKENCEMSQSKGTNAGIPDNIADNLHKTNSNNESSKMSYANRLADGMKPYNNDLFFIPTTMKDNGEKVGYVFDEVSLVRRASEKGRPSPESRFQEDWVGCKSVWCPFLPYLVSDHNPAIMIIPKGIVKKKKSFRFANYVVEKEDFLDLVKEGWKKDIRGYQIVIGLKEKLKEAQKEVDSDATNLDKRKIVVLLVNEYSKAAEDKLKLLCQKAKIKWLKEGDRNSSFFHSVIKARKHIRRILGEVNATLIALVPKIDTPNKVSDFRPMACCNIIYKCISKILTNRIKEGLSKVVSLNQRAFIPGRHIQDNILITQELLKGYNKKNGAKICAMKIDIQKAYDTISWEFLKEIMLLVRFHETMVSWIMTCISSASFSICINGEIKGFFKGGKGLRQGDPMSPYLFTLVMEVFNMLIMKNIRESGQFKFHYGCKDIKLTHMCFAAVSFFLKALNVKFEEDMLQILLLNGEELPLKYLGFHLPAKRIRGRKDCQSLIDKVERRIQLIASVLSTMQHYWASV
ncbi:RNA-directed DNA polymerase, eukaryota, reverse transcriptase zinc-binding domain protein [Tanacetum coccineum]|uniref:RNA-directed DNA polymerase, eukaryota, reverse transcriptase zinc-binding domain protein n=1 Tax=Tanacetum coccineum TaxID=301880 RepID=A0ABQ5D1S5_9ASTR